MCLCSCLLFGRFYLFSFTLIMIIVIVILRRMHDHAGANLGYHRISGEHPREASPVVQFRSPYTRQMHARTASCSSTGKRWVLAWKGCRLVRPFSRWCLASMMRFGLLRSSHGSA